MKTAVVLALLLAVLSGCSSAPKPTAQVVTPTYNWTPPETAPVASAAVNFGIVGAGFAESVKSLRGPVFEPFATHLGPDFVELLTAKGFTTSGPFASLDEMTYPEKKACDLILVPQLGLEPTVVFTGKHEQYSILMQVIGYKYDGLFTVGGTVTLSVLESLSGTKMWTKSIEVSKTSVPFKTENKYPVTTNMAADFDPTDPGFITAVTPTMEKIYGDILTQCWNYLSAEEMQQVKVQAAEVRSKTTFSGK